MSVPAISIDAKALPPAHHHALVTVPGSAPGLAPLQSGSGPATVWQPPASITGYGESWVRYLMQALESSGADLLLLPDPVSDTPLQRAIAWSGLEAARRHGRVACTWTTPRSMDGGTGQAWTTLPPAGEQAAPPAWGGTRAPHEDHDLAREHDTSPTVSVIVRSMDRQTLGQALDSIAMQTHPNVVVVIVNALGAGHRALPTRCGGFPVLVVAAADGQPWPRAVAANRGLDAAPSELALFLDDDDLLLPDHLAKLVHALQRAPDAAAAFSDVEMGQDGADRWQVLHRFDSGFDATRLLFENYLPIHGVLFRRPPELRLDESFDLFEDWDFWLNLAQNASFVHAPGVSAMYRVNGLQQSNVFSDTTAARQARSRLFEKWRQRLSPERYHDVLQTLQQLYRSSAQAQAELALARDGAAAQQAVLQAREGEIAGAALEQAATRQLVLAREQELADALAEIESLRQLLATREEDASAGATHASSLADLLQRREDEAENARQHAAGLELTLAAREREIADAGRHIEQLAATLVARDEEIVNRSGQAAELDRQLADRVHEVQHLVAQLADADRSLAQCRQELAMLHAETPLLAMKRTLRKKTHVSTER